MYLILRMDTTAKGAKKNTSPNVIHLQYFTHIRASPLSLDDSGENTSSVHLLAGKKVTCNIKCGTIKIPLCSVLVCMFVSPLKYNFCSSIIIH